MAAQTTGVALVDFNRTSATMNALGLLYQLYGEHLGGGSIPVALTGNSPQPAPKFPAGSPDQPEKTSGSPTYPLDMFAALSPDRKYLVLSVVNATESEQKFDLSVSGVHLGGPSKLWLLTGQSLTAVNRVGQAPQVEVKEIAIGDAPGTITAAPISVNIYRFAITQTAQ
jgi:alpha-N-arabinofuranosidase